MGQIYVQIDASVANGIMTMDSSGGGQTGGGYWLNWTASGYTGKGWLWNADGNYLPQGWAKAVTDGGGIVDNCEGDSSKPDGKHDNTYESFLVHMNNGHSENLNSILGSWDPSSKLNFVLNNAVALQGCVTPN